MRSLIRTSFGALAVPGRGSQRAAPASATAELFGFVLDRLVPEAGVSLQPADEKFLVQAISVALGVPPPPSVQQRLDVRADAICAASRSRGGVDACGADVETEVPCPMPLPFDARHPPASHPSHSDPATASPPTPGSSARTHDASVVPAEPAAEDVLTTTVADASVVTPQRLRAAGIAVAVDEVATADTDSPRTGQPVPAES
eukprot:TRINITY_DN33038_c0_g1_i1.p1 TRINITY_DN33038_c0_g1~~TRINITY_DN33038_c0_g1_i1.p1  ORF type:complete len:202 (+),score=33.39 TRINITY_DN33038_c0_g1_i1:214-819(+)